MRVLEIIELCTANQDHQFLKKQADSIKERASQEDGICINIYWNGFIDTDLSVHLRYENDSATVSFSPLGERVVSALKEYGLVRHTVWTQQLKV